MKFQIQVTPAETSSHPGGGAIDYPGTFREVEAAYMVIDGACLVFCNDDNQAILALAPGQWLTAHQEEAAKAALRSIHG